MINNITKSTVKNRKLNITKPFVGSFLHSHKNEEKMSFDNYSCLNFDEAAIFNFEVLFNGTKMFSFTGCSEDSYMMY